MSADFTLSEPIEPERYELFSGPAHRFNLERRDFFKLFGGGIVIVFCVADALGAQEAGGRRQRQEGESGRLAGGARTPKEIGAWLQIAEDGGITVYTGKVEVGQNARTALAQIAAEELRVPYESVRLQMADTDLTPYDMGTFGSQTTPRMGPQIRKAAAAAREALVDLAAEQWKVDRTAITVAGAKVAGPGPKQSATFGQLTRGQKLLKQISDDVPTLSAEQWKVAGTSARKADGRAFVTGKHQYTSDLKRPGMLYGKVVRPSALNAKLAAADTTNAAAQPGVTVVRDGEFIGVVAPDPQAAVRAAGLIKAEWQAPAQVSNGDLFAYLKKTAEEGRDSQRNGGGGRGSVADGLSAADHKLQQTYTVEYIAHAPLEPRAALAEWTNGKLTVWTGTQVPFGVRRELADAFHIPEDKVRVIVPDTGSGYGGKHTGEAALEAARLAKAAAKPVKLVWTREEEFTWAYFRPAGVIEISSGVRNDGVITAWEHHNYNSGGSGLQTMYDIANVKTQFHSARSPLRQGSYRGLAATANHFAREVHMDEMAHAVKMDPLEFRLRNLKDDRLRAVLQAAAAAFGWGKPKTGPDRGVGIAGGFEKGSYVATCAEIVVKDRPIRPGSAAILPRGNVKIVRAVSAFECGAIVNPDQLKNQVEGAMVMAIGGALFEAIEFNNGAIGNPRFSRYRVPRFSDLPNVEVVLVNRKDLPSAGAGETPIVGLAPAVGNAIFEATGVRLRSLPLCPSGVNMKPPDSPPASGHGSRS